MGKQFDDAIVDRFLSLISLLGGISRKAKRVKLRLPA
jgi:hypothetical protein